jgi:hypothetical protein
MKLNDVINTSIDVFPWKFVKKITFLKREVIIEFISGNGMTAKHSDRKKYNEFLAEAKKNLQPDQIVIGDIDE